MALEKSIGPHEIFMGDTNQNICIIYKQWLSVKDENTQKTCKRFRYFVKKDLKSIIAVYMFAGFTHSIKNVLLNVFKELSNVNLKYHVKV